MDKGVVGQQKSPSNGPETQETAYLDGHLNTCESQGGQNWQEISDGFFEVFKVHRLFRQFWQEFYCFSNFLGILPLKRL